MRNGILVLVALTAAAGQHPKVDWPTGYRTTPPIIQSVSPLGVPRGATTEMTIEGLNLADASAIFFSEPGIQARTVRIKELPDLPDIRLGSAGTLSTIDLGPLPPRNQVTLELDVSPDAGIGRVSFRLRTPLGASPEGRLVIEPYYGESPDREPNDTPEDAFESYLPTILVGAISRSGDVDYYKVRVKAGEELVFDNAGPLLGSALQPVLSIYDESQTLLQEYGQQGGRGLEGFAYRFEKAGTYYLRVEDYQRSGSARNLYRIKLGRFPLVTGSYPLGLQRGGTAEIKLAGYQLGGGKIMVKGEPSPEAEDAVILRPATPAGPAFNRLRLALGDDPEMEAAGTNTAAATAQPLAIQVTVNGRLNAPEHYFRWRARKGENVVLEVQAARLGSPLDSLLEVLDATGNPIERATVRCVLETSTTLRDHDSVSPGIRINSAAGFEVGDSVMIGGEILRVDAMPRTPDDDVRFQSFGGQRLAMLDTTSEAHATDTPVYKVQIHSPGAAFAPNGLPLVRLVYRNDDGGPGYGKDSRLQFTAPADGEYIVRLKDVRGFHGEEFAYRLAIRPPRPDFRLSVNPRNPNVPLGGRIPVTVTALRLDGLEAPIEVAVEDLPPGLTATRGVIGAGQVSTTLLLAVEDNARLEQAVPWKVVGRARVGARLLAHRADPEVPLKLISLMPKPDIQMVAKTKEIVLEPGGTAEVWVAIQRNYDFGGRVPVEVRNLPPGVRVLDVGLNGVLINEGENERKFVLEALPNAEPVEQPVIVAGKVETRADAQQTSYAAGPIPLRVKPRNQVSGLR